jgi:iron complex transport system substrate-binding protein
VVVRAASRFASPVVSPISLRLAAALFVSLLAAPTWVVAQVAQAAGKEAAQVLLRDDWGREVRVVRTPRIASLAPHATESLVVVGAASQLVAIDPHAEAGGLLAGVVRIPVWPAPDAEALHALAPQLIVAWGAGLDAARLRRLASIAPTFVSEPRSLEDIARTLERLAVLAPDPAAGFGAAARFRAELAELRQRHAGRAPVVVFYQVWDRPLITVSDRGVIGDAMRACGARNPFAALAQAAPVVDVEAVLLAAPQLVVVDDGLEAAARRWRQLGLWRAGRERIVQVDGIRLQRPSPHMLQAVRELCDAVETARQ